MNIEGLKLSILKKAIESNIEIINQYDSIWLPDDDLSISTDEINLLFMRFNEYFLDAAQPAVKNNFYNYGVTRKRYFSKLRYVNFIEMMCPLFNTRTLIKLLPTFEINKSGFGVDWLWSQKLAGHKVANYRRNKCYSYQALSA